MSSFLVAVLPVYLVLTGISYLIFPPAMGGKRGYRTPLSVQSEEVWAYAQKLYGKKLLLAAAMMLPLAVIRFLLAEGLLYSILFLVFEIVILYYAAVSTAQSLLHAMGRKGK